MMTRKQMKILRECLETLDTLCGGSQGMPTREQRLALGKVRLGVSEVVTSESMKGLAP